MNDKRLSVDTLLLCARLYVGRSCKSIFLNLIPEKGLECLKYIALLQKEFGSSRGPWPVRPKNKLTSALLFNGQHPFCILFRTFSQKCPKYLLLQFSKKSWLLVSPTCLCQLPSTLFKTFSYKKAEMPYIAVCLKESSCKIRAIGQQQSSKKKIQLCQQR